MKVMITGGAGYIGSHICVELLKNNIDVVIFDNFSNSSKLCIEQIEKISYKKIEWYEGDINHREQLRKVLMNTSIDVVIHCAGLKSVSESNLQPIKYYETNVFGTLNLVNTMLDFGIKELIFSSSATVYGNIEKLPVNESSSVGKTINPYATSKFQAEVMLRDIVMAHPELKVTVLRYFNPIGAHESGLIGESPAGVPNNLLPYITQVAIGKLECLSVFGDDYPTQDGTGVRDYIHVMDLARGHIQAIINPGVDSYRIFNLGTGCGYSVMQLVKAFEDVSGLKIPLKVMERREGDIAECWCDPTLAELQLKWVAKYSIKDMVRDAWKWQQKYPSGLN